MGIVLYHLPYGKITISIDIPSKYPVKHIKPDSLEPVPDEMLEIARAVKNPVNSRRLSEIARDRQNAVIIVDDITRPTPTAKLLPPLISELRAAGVEDTTAVFGLGLHRNQTEEEKRTILGELYGKVPALEHDVDNCVYLGTTSRGTPVEIFKPVMDADIVVGTGIIEFHYYAGYSGGAKCLLPAVSSKRSIDANHALMLDPRSSAGRLDGPVREDFEEAGRMLGIDFILNAVLNEKKEIAFAAAGDPTDVHRQGAAFLDERLKVKLDPADILIVSPGGWPKDINLFQSHKALEHAKNAVKEGGSIILVAECSEGYGNHVFEEWLEFDRDEVIERFKSRFVMGGHKAALIAALSKKTDLYMVSSIPDDMVRKAYCIPATLKGALEMAFAKQGKNATIVVMPYGVAALAC